MASDYDEVRPDVKESQESSLEALRTENTPDARSVVKELDEADNVDGVDLPGDYIAEELIVEVVPPKKDEFVCSSCFLVHHRSQLAKEKGGHAYCLECEG
jgi:Ran GTPase-activating protein (RanGAP) involved in mRNA processing and transport